MIREARLEDKKAVAKIFSEELKYHSGLQKNVFKAYDEENILTDGWYEKVISSDKTKIYVYEDSEVLKALIMITIQKDREGIYEVSDWIDINELAVLDAYRGRGIGSEMMAFIEAMATDRHIGLVKLEVWMNNHMAVNFYEKNDYHLKKNIYWKVIE